MLKAKFASAGLPLMPSETQNLPTPARRLPDQGQADQRHPARRIRPLCSADQFPHGSRRGTERLRFTPGPHHSADMMDELTKALVEILEPRGNQAGRLGPAQLLMPR